MGMGGLQILGMEVLVTPLLAPIILSALLACISGLGSSLLKQTYRPVNGSQGFAHFAAPQQAALTAPIASAFI